MKDIQFVFFIDIFILKLSIPRSKNTSSAYRKMKKIIEYSILDEKKRINSINFGPLMAKPIGTLLKLFHLPFSELKFPVLNFFFRIDFKVIFASV